MICPHPSAKKQVTLRMHHGDANVPAKGRRFPTAHVLDLNVGETPFRGCGRRPIRKEWPVYLVVSYPQCERQAASRLAKYEADIGV